MDSSSMQLQNYTQYHLRDNGNSVDVENEFDHYMIYIEGVKTSILEWLEIYVTEYCDEIVDGKETKWYLA